MRSWAGARIARREGYTITPTSVPAINRAQLASTPARPDSGSTYPTTSRTTPHMSPPATSAGTATPA